MLVLGGGGGGGVGTTFSIDFVELFFVRDLLAALEGLLAAVGT